MDARRLAALALPVLALACDRGSTGCTVHVRGAVREDLRCVADSYSRPTTDLDAPLTWGLSLEAHRVDGEQAVLVLVGVPLGPELGTAYGWGSDGANVDGGVARRSAGDVSVLEDDTHRALAPEYGEASGALSVTFTAVPALDGSDELHGTLTATLPPVDAAGAPITLTATF